MMKGPQACSVGLGNEPKGPTGLKDGKKVC